nr:RNA-directed DNA polymerase, eukaryota [Tanacetum cinerariifolium]
MPRSGIESEQWDHLLDSLEGVMLNPSKDRWSWDLNGSGEFSVALARRYIDNNRLPDISSKTRWIKEVPIKVNVHAWKDWELSLKDKDKKPKSQSVSDKMGLPSKLKYADNNSFELGVNESLRATKQSGTENSQKIRVDGVERRNMDKSTTAL